MPTTLKILTHPNKNLRVRAQEVDQSWLNTMEFKKFARDLSYTMRKQDGVGLAATQVNIQKRIICIKDSAAESKKDLIIINPEWFPLNKKTDCGAEGCLSVPGKFGEVERYVEIQVSGIDENANKLNFKASEFFSRVIQHEVDHLNGVLFIDKAKEVQTIKGVKGL
jgi:peptide deformylase